ncbi:hypothetical protein Dda_5291 [Drechslerella dactyloides]|uniref:Uncharacterized protein n=1 Tax=Drechslerella dactyloides TaxID=74499 RepID=A0AAD6IVT9_DREDA|nr:hypothetical protein Dda_5291 [Drechslerella dactyloides]
MTSRTIFREAAPILIAGVGAAAFSLLGNFVGNRAFFASQKDFEALESDIKKSLTAMRKENKEAWVRVEKDNKYTQDILRALPGCPDLGAFERALRGRKSEKTEVSGR